MSKVDKIRRRLVVVVEGVGLNEYLSSEHNLAVLNQFETRLELCSPLSYGGNLVQELALVPVTKTQQQNLRQNFGSLKEAMEAGEMYTALRTMFTIKKSVESRNKRPSAMTQKTDSFSRTQLLLSPFEMLEDGYPLPISSDSNFSDFVKTREEYGEVSDDSPMWSIDCEMCRTSAGNELTRICIINESHEIVYESLVKPSNKITDYMTQFSGITKEMLEPVRIRLKDVQEHIRSICPPDVIFIGQSLNFDLIAMKMIHPYVIDTSVIFNLSGIRHRKTKLRVLTEEFLSERIQLGETGHSPIEDALAAMKLVQLKLQHSLSWGNAVLSGPRPERESEAARRLLEARAEIGEDRLQGCEVLPSSALNAQSLFSHLTRHDHSVFVTGKEREINEWKEYFGKAPRISSVTAPTQRAAIKAARSSAASIILLHLRLPPSLTSEFALSKADRLIGKLLRVTEVNTLYAILLAGSHRVPNNGLLFLHLLREHIPFVTLPTST